MSDDGGRDELVVGEPDGFERLWTPHRMAYIDGPARPADRAREKRDCPFCVAATATDDDDVLVVARARLVYVVLNRFPYNTAHLLICPYRHVGDLADLTPEETTELALVSQRAVTVLRAEYAPTGMNLGMNLGETAGAGITGHVHQHVVPRWVGDANFLPIVARTKALPELLADTRARLAAAWAAQE